MTISRRTFVGSAAAAAALGVSEAACAQTEVFTPEMFGARGDGVTNDSAAFAQLSDAVNANGGGTVRLRRATYLVGGHNRLRPDPTWSFPGVRLLDFRNLTRPLVVEGNGATLRCADGLRYGTFNRITGAATKNPMPYVGQGELATPYRYMIAVEDCRGPVTIRDVELDGNLRNLLIGGQYGDTGWQIPAVGLFLRNNRGDEIVRNLHAHHHAQDGIMIDGLDDLALANGVRRRFENVRSEYNGRQGCSLIGGRGCRFVGCKFNHTGKAGLVSAPAAGVDIEAEGEKTNRDHSFTNCEFINNSGCGLVADSGDSEGVSFTGCTFIGTTNWSAWPFKPRIRFDKCNFIGAVVKVYGDDDPARANQFHDCIFRDDPKLSPTGEVYMPLRPGYMVDANFGTNALFNRCVFRFTHDGLLPYSWKAIYRDCRMDQQSRSMSYPKGRYLGASTINAVVDLYGTHVIGSLLLNGTPVPQSGDRRTSW